MVIPVNKRLFAKLVLICALPAALLAQTPSAIDFSISFYDQQVYFPGDPVQIRISVVNNSAGPYSFRLADNRIFNLEFELVDLSNVAQPASEQFTTLRMSNQRIYFRDISLNPGEEFSFIEDLSNFRTISEGIYVVRANFFPELVGPANGPKLTSNRLTLAVRPGFRVAERRIIAAEEAVTSHLRATPIPPDEVISQLIQSRMHGQKEAFFLHLDITSLYRMDPRNDNIFRRLSEREQFTVLNDFRESLWNPSIQDNISRIPLRYEILRTSYDASTATVDTIQKYQMDSYIEVKRYTYKLNKRDGIWFLTSYTVTNLGTE